MVTNRVFKVLATNGTAMTNLADAGAGKYLIIKADGSTIAATTALDRDEKVQIVVNSQNGTKVFSDRIRVGDVHSLLTKAYAARTEQVVTLTPGTPVAGLEYTVAIITKSDKDYLQARQSKRTYSVTAVAGETATTLVGKFVAAINKDRIAPVVASGTATLVLTAKTVADTPDAVGITPNQIVFQVFPYVLDPAAQFSDPVNFGSQVDTAAVAYGTGQYSQLAKLDQASQGYKGLTNQTLFPVDVFSASVSAGTNYDVAVLENDNVHDTNVVVEGEKAAPITTIVAVTAGNSAGIFAILARIAGAGDQAATV